MCKLAGWTSSKEHPLTKAAADAAIVAAHKVIGQTERDGFGYAQAGASGLRAKFVDPKEYRGIDCLANLYKRAGKGAGAFATAYRTSIEGAYKPDKSMMIHGRTATCGISLENVHPFRRNGWTLAHNGVCGYAGEDKKAHAKVTCDSQHLLICMADNTPNIKRKEDLENITGYAAFLALNPQGKLFVAVDDTATLFAGITSKGRWIFGTKPTIVEAIADAWNCKGVDAYPIDAWTWLEFEAAGGDPDLGEWKHRKANERQLGFASQSLGAAWDTSKIRKHRAGHTHVNYGSGYGTGYGSKVLSAMEAEEQKELITESDALRYVDERALSDAENDGVPAWEGY